MKQDNIIVDFSNLMYRSYYVVPEPHRGGTPPGGTVMFFRILRALAKQYPLPMVFAFEGGRALRKDIDENYKAQRQTMPDRDEFIRQWDMVIDLLNKAGAVLWQVDGYEADDLIASWVKQHDCYIFSADRDFDGLVRPGVSIVKPTKSNMAYDVFDLEKFEQEYGFSPEGHQVYKALVGDSSDNIKGISGWGPKKTSRAVKNYGTDVERMRKNGAGKDFDTLRREWLTFEKNMSIFSFRSDAVFDKQPSVVDMNMIFSALDAMKSEE